MAAQLAVKSIAKSCISLERLYLRETRVTDAGLKSISRLKNLKGLDIGFNDVSDACVKDIGKLRKLEWVFLGGTNVTRQGLKELAEELPKCDRQWFPKE